VNRLRVCRLVAEVVLSKELLCFLGILVIVRIGEGEGGEIWINGMRW
jgi:hypothetical protein